MIKRSTISEIVRVQCYTCYVYSIPNRHIVAMLYSMIMHVKISAANQRTASVKFYSRPQIQALLKRINVAASQDTKVAVQSLPFTTRFSSRWQWQILPDFWADQHWGLSRLSSDSSVIAMAQYWWWWLQTVHCSGDLHYHSNWAPTFYIQHIHYISRQ